MGKLASPMSDPASARAITTPRLEAHALSRPQRVYLWLAAINVTALLLANVVGVKVFAFGANFGFGELTVEHTAGMLAFPITFLLTDLLNEYFGRRATRRVAYIAFTMAALAWGLIWVSRQLPTRLPIIPGTATHEAYEMIFGASSVMYLASIVAFLVGALLDIWIFGVFKRATGGRYVWLRATGSTVVSQFFDSLIVTFLFFWSFPKLLGSESATLGMTLKIALTGYILKFVIAVVLTPVIYAGRALLRDGLGLQPLPSDVNKLPT